VIGETALAMVLLAGAGLLIRTFIALRAVDPGFDAHNVLTMQMSLAGSRFENTAEVERLISAAVQRVEAIPGVASAGASYILPLEGGFGVPFNIVGRTPANGIVGRTPANGIVGRTPANGRYDGRGWIPASPGYFDLFKIPILRGRAFNDLDSARAGRVAIINQAMARTFWPQVHAFSRGEIHF